ncbi:hypothetical protein A7G45_31225 [Mycolicibacterium llatzerense]|nr:hypothetical protein [Mycolicibacterium llatzerense]
MPAPPGGPTPGTGAATDAANKESREVAAVLAQLHELDKSAASTIDAIHAAGTAGQQQLDGITKDVQDKITELGPRLNTPAGQQELRDFLKEKLTAAKKVIDQQIADADAKARHTRELTQKYADIGGGDDVKPAGNAGNGGNGGVGGGPSGGGPTGSSEQGTTPSSAPVNAAAPGTSPYGQGMMPGAGMMPAGMSMPQMPSFGGGGMPSFGGGGDPLSALGGLGSQGLGHDASSSFRDDINGGKGSGNDGPSNSKFKDGTETGSGNNGGKPGSDTNGSTTPAGAPGTTGGATELAGNHQNAPGIDPNAPAPTTHVSLPGGLDTEARTVQGAQAVKAALGGSTVADAWHQAGVTVPPPGTPVTDPIPPTKLKAGDVGIWQDHLVMALGNGKVLVSGQPQPLSSVGTGPDFLGWMDPSALAPKGGAPATPPAAAPPQPPAAPPGLPS